MKKLKKLGVMSLTIIGGGAMVSIPLTVASCNKSKENFSSSIILTEDLNGDVSTMEYSKMSLPYIGNVPKYSLECQEIYKNGEKMNINDYDIVFQTSNNKVVKLIDDPAGNSDKKYLQILNIGFSNVSANIYHKNHNKNSKSLYSVSKKWSLDDRDLKSSYWNSNVITNWWNANGQGIIDITGIIYSCNLSIADFNGFPVNKNDIFTSDENVKLINYNSSILDININNFPIITCSGSGPTATYSHQATIEVFLPNTAFDLKFAFSPSDRQTWWTFRWTIS